MYAEIIAAINSTKTLMDLLKAAHGLSNFNEVNAAVYEVTAKLMTASAVALESQEKQATLAQRMRDLEQKLMELEDWKHERERYQLATVARGIFAYRVKPGMEQGEPPHELCANCFTQSKKSILQCQRPVSAGPRLYSCPRCKTSLVYDA